jgi:hypothetical protein
VDAVTDVGQLVLVLADADANALGVQRPDAELDRVVIERSCSESAFPWMKLDGFRHPLHGTHSPLRRTRPRSNV